MMKHENKESKMDDNKVDDRMDCIIGGDDRMDWHDDMD